MSGRITCHSNQYLIFPKQCVCCGREPKAIHTVRVFRQIDFIVFAVSDESLITVPLCRRCYFVRSFFGPFVGMLSVMAAMGIPFILSVATLNPWLQQFFMFVFLVATLLGFLYYRNWNATIMDRLLSGISAGKLQKDRTFSLWLRREELIPELFYSPTLRRYIETKSYATYDASFPIPSLLRSELDQKLCIQAPQLRGPFDRPDADPVRLRWLQFVQVHWQPHP